MEVGSVPPLTFHASFYALIDSTELSGSHVIINPRRSRTNLRRRIERNRRCRRRGRP